MAVEDRHLADGAREGHRQLAARVGVAEQHVGDGRPTLLARQPGLQDGRDVLGDPGDGQRPAVDQHHHGRRTGGDHRLHQRLLDAGQVQVGPIPRFASSAVIGQPRLVAHHEDGHLRLPGRCYRLVKPVAPVAVDVAALRKVDCCFRRHRCFDGLQH